MDSALNLVSGGSSQGLLYSHLHNSVINLLSYAEDTLSSTEKENLYHSLIEALQGAIDNVHSAAQAVNALSDQVATSAPPSEKRESRDETQIVEILDSLPNVVSELELDMTGVDTLSSSTIGKFLKVNRALSAKGNCLVLKNVNSHLRDLVESTFIDRDIRLV